MSDLFDFQISPYTWEMKIFRSVWVKGEITDQDFCYVEKTLEEGGKTYRVVRATDGGEITYSLWGKEIDCDVDVMENYLERAMKSK